MAGLLNPDPLPRKRRAGGQGRNRQRGNHENQKLPVET